MALIADEVRVAITGEVHVAPPDAAAVTSATQSLTSPWTGLGYNNDEGIVESFEESTEVLRAWQNNAAFRTIVTESEARLAFTMIQTNKATLELFHKGSKIVDDGNGGFRMDVILPTPDPRSFVIDVIDGDEHIRFYVPRGEVVERGEVSYVGGAAVGYNVTISCTPVEMEVGGEMKPVPYVKFSNSPAWGEEESA